MTHPNGLPHGYGGSPRPPPLHPSQLPPPFCLPSQVMRNTVPSFFFFFLGTGANYNSRNRKRKQPTKDKGQETKDRTKIWPAAWPLDTSTNAPPPSSAPDAHLGLLGLPGLEERWRRTAAQRAAVLDQLGPAADLDDVGSICNLAPLAPHAFITWPSEATFLPQTSALPSPVSGFRSSILPSIPPS